MKMSVVRRSVGANFNDMRLKPLQISIRQIRNAARNPVDLKQGLASAIGKDSKKEEILSIIKNRRKTRTVEAYVDLENIKLDLSVPNNKLVEMITANCQARMLHRFIEPNELWSKNLFKLKISNEDISEQIEESFKNGTISSIDFGKPVSIGDLVILTQGSTEFYIVVGVPQDIGSNSYTYINSKGRIVFGSKGSIKFRIPSVFPEKVNDVLASLVLIEDKVSGIAPIGISDEDLTTSKPNSESKQIQSIEFSDDDLLSAHASPKLLKDTDINTYIVPPKARQIYCKPLTKLSIDSMEQYQELSGKLEMLHRLLQYDEMGDVITQSRTVSIFKIMYMLETFDIDNTKVSLTRWKQQIQSLYGKGSSKLGKQITSIDCEERKTPINSYFATVLALRKQDKLWKLVEQNSINPVNSIIILPLQDIAQRDQLAKYLKLDSKIIVDHIVGTIQGESRKLTIKQYDYYVCTINLIKDFVVGNIDDLEMVSKVARIIREIEVHIDLPGNFAYDYGRSKAFEILKKLGEVGEGEEFIHWSWGLDTEKLPLEEEYFKYLEVTDQGNMKAEDLKSIDLSNFQEDLGEIEFKQNDFYEDPMEHIRQPFNQPIFCIDSPDAHEIDDGISIVSNDDTYTIGIHIANPSSLIDPYSTTSQIAFRKGTTTYLPSGPIRMVPEYISDMSGLGNGEAKTFTIEFDIPKDLQNIKQMINETKRIKFYNATNFPKGYTYERVNDIINGDQDIFSQEINGLFKISEIFKTSRLQSGGIELNRNNQVMKITKTNSPDGFDELANGYEVISHGNKISLIEEQFNKSTTLVTEFMIMGNHVTSLIAEERGIPVIFRNQRLNVSDEMHDKMKNPQTYQDELNIFQHMTPASLSMINKGHQMLGLSGYCQITSPLRRYSDLVNQWNFQNYFLSRPMIKISPIINHLIGRDVINRQISVFCQRYWSGEILKYQKDMKFKVFVKKFFNDNYKVDLIGFRFNTLLNSDNKLEFKLLEKQLEFDQIDIFENEVIARIKKSSAM
ncbi:hypothetical protein CLIB1444_01S09054 [[Candida] jaroonii]|uniref:Uncharacterized protein n=1 Tax=[Candida] jaroonii TaxID=467808 RepID=A0ACA9Y0U3_9ASCO|nr:hypothetical protein CLIB1444_01S09054 [[Candida] jaroonii]